MPTILLRMSTERYSSSYLLDHVDAMIMFLLEFSYDRSQIQHDIYKAKLCRAIAAAMSVDHILAYLSKGPYDDSVKVCQNMRQSDKIEMLAAAAAVDSEAALGFFVGKVLSASAYSELYAAPLLAAAINGSVKVVTILFKCMQSEKLVRQELGHTIYVCMKKQQTVMLPTLIKWYFGVYKAPMRIKRAKYHWRNGYPGWRL